MSVRLKSTKLINKSGKEVNASKELGSKIVFLYFSAHWCPPCRYFTPKFAEEYNTLKKDQRNVEVIFVSSDRSTEDWKEYYGEMPWLALDFDQRELKDSLGNTFECKGIPYLVWLNPKTGEIIKNGRETIDVGAEWFPWT